MQHQLLGCLRHHGANTGHLVTGKYARLAIRPLPCLRSTCQTRPLAQIAKQHARGLCTAAGSSSSSSEAAAAEPATSITSGQLDLIIGPMFAGKTSALLKRVNELEAQGLTVVAIKSAKDTRYHASRLVTHDGQSRECFAASSLAEFKKLQASEYKASQAIAIDEAQFFPDLLEFCLEAAERDNKLVVVAGLSGDFRRKKFGEVLDLVPLVDNVTKVTADCAFCNQKALFSLRIAADQRQEVVGGADKYAPVCRHHFSNFERLRSERYTDAVVE